MLDGHGHPKPPTSDSPDVSNTLLFSPIKIKLLLISVVSYCCLPKEDSSVLLWQVNTKFKFKSSNLVITIIPMSCVFLDIHKVAWNRNAWLILGILRTYCQHCPKPLLAQPKFLVVDLPYHLLEQHRCKQLCCCHLPLEQQCWSHWGTQLLLWVANGQLIV